MKRYILLLFPLGAMACYLWGGGFLCRSATTLLCLAIVALAGLRRPRLTGIGWLAGALALSFCGDYVLGHWGGSFEGFVAGVGLFLLAHLGYAAFCLALGRFHWRVAAVLLAVFGTYYVVLLHPAIGDAVTSAAVFAYIVVSCLSMAAAAGLGRGRILPRWTCILFMAGIASLLFSDLLIAQKRFLHDGTLYMLMMPTYFASQILVAAAILHLRGGQSESVSRP